MYAYKIYVNDNIVTIGETPFVWRWDLDLGEFPIVDLNLGEFPIVDLNLWGFRGIP